MNQIGSKSWKLLAIGIALVIGPPACGVSLPSAPPIPEVAAEVVREDSYPTHPVTFPNGVTGIPDVAYWNPVGYRPLTLDLYLPPKSLDRPEGGFPLVVHVHGGGWMSGDTRHSGPFVDFPGVLASLSARGYVVASVEYRSSSEAKFPAQAQDVKAAIRWLRVHAPEHGIDPTRAVTWGESAGGHLAALMAVSCEASALAPTPSVPLPGAPPDIALADVSDCVQGSVAWFGVFDMSTIREQVKEQQAKGVEALSRDDPGAPEWRLLGCFDDECGEGVKEAASPVSYVDANDPPMLLIVGGADVTVPTEQTMQMGAALEAAGVSHGLLVLPDVGHGFIGPLEAQTRDANLSALAATFEFIDKTIGS